MSDFPLTEALIEKALVNKNYACFRVNEGHFLRWVIEIPSDGKSPKIVAYQHWADEHFSIHLKRRFRFEKFLFHTRGKLSEKLFEIVTETATATRAIEKILRSQEDNKEDSRVAKIMEKRL